MTFVIIICPNCNSQIAVNSVFDVDCDCGQVIKGTIELKC